MYALIVDIEEKSYVEHMIDADAADQWEKRLNKKFPNLTFTRHAVISLNHPTRDEDRIVTNYGILEAENDRLELEANGVEG